MLTIADSQPEAATVANLCKYGDGDGDAPIVLAFKESPREVAAYLLGSSAGGCPTELEELRSERNHLAGLVSPLKAEVKRLRYHLEKVDQILVAVGAEEMAPNRTGAIEWLASARNSAEQEQKRLREQLRDSESERVGLRELLRNREAAIKNQKAAIRDLGSLVLAKKGVIEDHLTTIKNQKGTIARLRNVIEDQKQHMIDPDGVQVGGPIDLEGGELLVWDGLHGEPEFATPETGFDPEEKLVIYIIRNHRVVWRSPDAVEEG